jgi:alpha-D-xyloside xylohydrolase
MHALARCALAATCLGLAASAPAAIHLVARGKRIRLAGAEVKVRVRANPYAIRIFHKGRLVTLEDRAGGVFYERDGVVHRLGAVRSVEKILAGASLAVATDEGQDATVTLRIIRRRTLEVAVTPPAPETVTAIGDRFRSPRNEVIYGLTERLRDSPSIAPPAIDVPRDDVMPVAVGSLDRRGETVEMVVRPTFSLYAPFYQSSRGYGLVVAGTTFGRFDVAASDPRIVSFRFETGTTPESRRLVFHVLLGPDHATILDQYTALTGLAFVPPDWAFLNWRWRDELAAGPTAALDGVQVNAQVAEDVLMYERLGIPPGVYLFDRPVLEGEFGFARFVFDETRLPNSVSMLASLRARGYRIGTWSSTWACGSDPGDNGLEAQLFGFLAPGPGGTPHCADLGGQNFILDPTSAGFSYWRDKIRAFVEAYDIDVIKLDRGEEHIPSEATDVWADGRTGREVRNDYPNLQAALHNFALHAAKDTDFVLFSRPGYTGTQRYAVFWGGDIPGSEQFGLGAGTDLGLRSAIISQQRAAFMGFPIWGSDTGGYYEFRDREVFARWIEFSAFSGIMEIGGKGTHAPWDMPTAPAYDQEMIDIYRRYAQLRVRLLPYIVAAAAEAERGLPIVRPMPFFDRRDPKLRDLWDQYMFGPDLLVAPVWKVGERSRKVYLPRGRWRSYWSPGKVLRGRRTITVDAPLDTIPVFVRAGAQVP